MEVKWVHSDAGSYAMGSKDKDACSILALSHYSGQPFEVARIAFDHEIKDQGKHEKIWDRIWRRVYWKAGLFPVRLTRVMGLHEIWKKYGQCIVHTHMMFGNTSHVAALVDGKLYDWMDSRPWPPFEVWVPKELASRNRWKQTRVGQDNGAWERDCVRIFGCSIDEHIKAADSRRKKKK